MKSSKKLDKLYKQQKNQNEDHPLTLKYQKYKQIYTKIKRTSKSRYYNELIQNVKGDVRKTWQTLNKLIGKTKDKSATLNCFKRDGMSITNPNEITNNFCSYFTKVGEDLASKIPEAEKHFQQYLSNTNRPHSLFISPTDPQEIQQIITSLKPKKSSGYGSVLNSLRKPNTH